MQPIKNNPDLYIFERPIKTDIGTAYPIMMKDYPEFIQYYSVFLYDKPTILITLNKEALKCKKEDNIVGFEYYKMLYEECDDRTVFDIIQDSSDPNHGLSGFNYMYESTKGLFEMCFREDVFYKIQDQEMLDDYLKLLSEMNGIEYEEPTTNPDILRDRRAQRFLAEASGQNITLESKITSVELATGKDITEFTMYKFNKMFERIAHFKNHDDAILYSTVAPKIKVPAWYRSEFEEEKQLVLTDKELERARNSQKYTNKL